MAIYMLFAEVPGRRSSEDIDTRDASETSLSDGSLASEDEQETAWKKKLRRNRSSSGSESDERDLEQHKGHTRSSTEGYRRIGGRTDSERRRDFQVSEGRRFELGSGKGCREPRGRGQ